MNLIKKLTEKQINKKTDYDVQQFKVGDIIHVRMLQSKKDRRKQGFSGICIGKRHKGYQSSFTLVNMLYGQRVCKTIPQYTKLLINMKVVESRTKIHKSKLYNYKVKRQIY